EHAALHQHHVERSVVIALIGRAAAVREDGAFEAAIVRFAHRRVDADIGRDARQHQIHDAARTQYHFEVRRAERAFAGLVDDDLAFDGLQFVDDLPARFTAHEYLA